jgi:hypothetical protein
MPAPGTRLEVSEELGRHLLQMGVVARFETKIDPVPEVKKNRGLSGLSQAVPAQRLTMPQNLPGFATKS